VQDGGDHELDVAVIEADEGVAEVHRCAVGEAGCQAEHPVLAAGAGQAVIQGGDRGAPVDDGQAVAVAGDGDEAAGEVAAFSDRLN
jgi:hypothetical protein